MNASTIFIAGGLLVILVAWVPLFIRGFPLSLAMIAVALQTLALLATGRVASHGAERHGIVLPAFAKLVLPTAY